jgi:hypothetical protein
MARKTIYCVQPYRREGKKLVGGDLRQFKTEADARRVGEGTANRAAGVIVYEIEGDAEFDDWGEPRMLAVYGDVPEASF